MTLIHFSQIVLYNVAMATIKEIARLAHVSTATVSNVLNGKAGAAGPEKSAEIFEIARKLNYTVNVFARRLQRGKSNSIGIITEDLTVFNTPDIVDGIDEFCAEHGYDAILENMRLFKKFGNNFIDTPAHHALLDATLKSLLEKQVEGVIYVGYHCREISYVPQQLSVPLIYAYCYSSNATVPSVLMDDEKAGYDVTCRLIKQGYTNIGVICGPLTSYHTQKRLTGYQEALFDNNILYNAKIVMYGDWERASGYHYAPVLLDAGVTAVFAFNDLMAGGFADWCRNHNIYPGADIAVFGFDNREVSRFYTPQLSTVALPLQEIGRQAASLVLSGAADKAEVDSILLPCILHERSSSCM